jgi:pSer/pThr/pTyr-binding forkhead associated (FHA) protein
MGNKPSQLVFQTSRFTLRGEECVVGRSDYCSVLVAHSSISRVHASITNRDGAMFIQDLGSRNGTFVNGERVGSDPVRLRPGDAVRLGSLDATIEEGDDNPVSTRDFSAPEASDPAAVPPRSGYG